MNLYKYIALGVFACICFLGGFLLGDWAAYDEKLIKEIGKSNAEHFEYANRAMELSYKTDELIMLLIVKKGGSLDEHIKLSRQDLSKLVESLEKGLENYPFKERNFIFPREIKRAKEILSKENT